MRFSFCVGRIDGRRPATAPLGNARQRRRRRDHPDHALPRCDGWAKALAQSGAACTSRELLRRLEVMARSPLSGKPHDRERSSIEACKAIAKTQVSPENMEVRAVGDRRGQARLAQLSRGAMVTLVLTSGEAAETCAVATGKSESAEDSPKLGPRWVRPHNLAA